MNFSIAYAGSQRSWNLQSLPCMTGPSKHWAGVLRAPQGLYQQAADSVGMLLSVVSFWAKPRIMAEKLGIALYRGRTSRNER